MILGIDASNIRSGGGVTHLIELLGNAEPEKYGFTQVIVWACGNVANKLPKSSWLKIVNSAVLEKHSSVRLVWQIFYLSHELKKYQCDILFSPGSTYLGGFRPFVSMSQNMLPFEHKERDRFKYSLTWLRYLLLKLFQENTLKRADGYIFLSEYAKKYITEAVNHKSLEAKVIPHGISENFLNSSSKLNKQHAKEPFQWLYVSIVNLYKHQWKVVKALNILLERGHNVSLNLVGASTHKAKSMLDETIRVSGVEGRVIYSDFIPHLELVNVYKSADAFVFASSCENLPNILIEAMASRLAIASSSFGPMPEVLGSSGVYFNPEDEVSIADAMEKIMVDEELRMKLEEENFNKSKQYSWLNCADQTFEYLRSIVS